MKAAVAAALFVLSSCHHAGPKPVVGPDGQQAYSIDCDQDSVCLSHAGEACPRGYNVLSRNQSFDWWSWTSQRFSYLVECKTPQ